MSSGTGEDVGVVSVKSSPEGSCQSSCETVESDFKNDEFDVGSDQKRCDFYQTSEKTGGLGIEEYSDPPAVLSDQHRTIPFISVEEIEDHRQIRPKMNFNSVDFDKYQLIDDEAPEITSKDREDLHVVGIGASAGGLDAIKAFFSSFNVRQEELSRLTFVVIQHISISYKSMMLEILSSQLHDIKLFEVTHLMKIEPRSIYFIPSKYSMTIRDRVFHLHPREDDSPGFLPIDKFFTSLAESFHKNAIGVVLSGTGKDGTEGIKAIHREKGVVLVQNVESAEFDGMPKSAADTGVVDAIMYPEDMLCFIFDLVGNRMTQSGDDNDVSVYQLLRLVEGDADIDFSHYKYPTLQRRVSRRMKENGCVSLKEYRDILLVNKMERMKLIDSVLIDVTSFFRGDFNFFENHLIPQIVELIRPSETIRVWVPACSTGEEAYSIAMLLLEYREISNKPFDIKIFATDVKSSCLRVAQKGEYPHPIEKLVSPKRLIRFFTKTKTHYRVKSEVRNVIVFVKHNIISNNPFINLHLISCRNCLIYMKVEAQKLALQSFHFGLADGGFLMLGSSESVHKSISGFIIFNRKSNVFRKSQRQKLSDFNALPLSRSKPSKPSDILSLLSKEMILYHYPYALLIVDGDWSLIYANEIAKRFISLSFGTIISNVADMVIPSLKVPLKSSILRAKTRGENVSITSINLEEEVCDLDTLCLNLDDMIVFAVIIKPRELEKNIKGIVPSEHSSIIFLQEELQKTKQELQHTMEQLETSNEELQSSNEELQSSNEELQSTNEELRCINREFQDKIRLLNEINNDMNHLIWSINIGIMFLGSDLKIRKFTPAITPIVSVKECDIGRSISDLVFKGSANVIPMIKKVLTSGIRKETSITLNKRLWSVRILPYITNSDVTGVIVTSYERFVVDSDQKNNNLGSEDGSFGGDFSSTTSVPENMFNSQGKDNEFIFDLLRPRWNPESLSHIERQKLADKSFWEEENGWLVRKKSKIKEFTSQLQAIVYTRQVVDLRTLAYILNNLLSIISGEFGYIAEHRFDSTSKEFYLVTKVMNDISWDQESRLNFVNSLWKGVEFRDTSSIIMSVFETEDVVIINDPVSDQRPSGLLPKHPQLKNFMAFPLMLDDMMIGSIGLANRPNGFNEGVAKVLAPIVKLISKCLMRYFICSEERLQKEINHQYELNQKTLSEMRYRSILEGNLEEEKNRADNSILEFLSTISSEIRTPLNAIISTSTELLKSGIKSTQSDMINGIQKNAHLLQTIIKDILDYTKFPQSRVILQKDSFNLYRCFEETMLLVKKSVQSKGLRIDLLFGEDVPIMVKGDEIRLRQIILNLLNNASKFTSEGRIIIRVEILQLNEVERNFILKFEIEDTGCGIHPSQREKIFDFQHSETVPNYSSRSFNITSSGLGLPICRRLAVLMHGSISVESEYGVGSTFTCLIHLEYENYLDTNPPVRGIVALVDGDFVESRSLVQKSAILGVSCIQSDFTVVLSRPVVILDLSNCKNSELEMLPRASNGSFFAFIVDSPEELKRIPKSKFDDSSTVLERPVELSALQVFFDKAFGHSLS